MPNLQIPDLSFPEVAFGKLETPWSLLPLLYRGGAGANCRKFAALLSDGKFGKPIRARLTLVVKLHEELQGELVGGGSVATVDTRIRTLRSFYAWADKNGRTMSMDSIERDYLDYTEHLLHRKRVDKSFSANLVSLYARVSTLIDTVLDRKVPLLTKTNIRFPTRKKRVLGTQAEKQNLEQTFVFGHALLDVVDALSVEAIRGPMPLKIVFRSGQVLEDWCGYRQPRVIYAASIKPNMLRKLAERRVARAADTSLRTRHSLINLRIEAELLIFIAQTGMNLAQAQKLRVGEFRYQSHLDGYKVYRVYKGRRGGEVEFEIFDAYRPHFVRYIAWLNTILPPAEHRLLFPFVPAAGRQPSPNRKIEFWAVIGRFRNLQIKTFRPRVLRMTRVNWLLRRSNDPGLTAEMAQHTQETLLRVYEQPHHQVAIIEISRFHANTDPALRAPGPGTCVKAIPKALPDTPSEATQPDCISPAGCLFCEHQRDIDCLDHAWSLASYRHLKSLELSRYRPPVNEIAAQPAMITVQRVTEKLEHFGASSEIRATWVAEALSRVAEGDYHGRWDGFIQLLELHA